MATKSFNMICALPNQAPGFQVLLPRVTEPESPVTWFPPCQISLPLSTRVYLINCLKSARTCTNDNQLDTLAITHQRFFGCFAIKNTFISIKKEQLVFATDTSLSRTFLLIKFKVFTSKSYNAKIIYTENESYGGHLLK